MKRNLSRKLLEMFGDELDPIMGSKIGDVEGIKKVGAVGVRDMRREDAVVCPHCGEMPIGGECGCNRDVCPTCGQMPPKLNSSCGCGLMEAKSSTCEMCGEAADVCECGMYEGEVEEVAPPGHEKMVRGLKKASNVSNPWAVAWAHYKEKHPGGRGKRHR